MRRKWVIAFLVPIDPPSLLKTASTRQAVIALDVEGIVAKWKRGRYLGGGDTTTWIKIENPEYPICETGTSGCRSFALAAG